MSNPTWLYVAVVYAVAVWAARRAGAPLSIRAAIFFYALVLVYLFEPMTREMPNTHADFLKTLPPWGLLRRDWHVANGLLNDVPLQFTGWAAVVREAWKSLELPLWNPYAGSGSPLLANGQSSALSPIRLLALPLSLAHSLVAEAAMKILVALTFMFLYCRRRCGELPSIFGAVTFAFSGFLFVWLHFPHATTVCWAPAILYFVDAILEKPTPARIFAGGAAWAAMVFGGHPETVAHVTFFALLYILWVVFVESRWDRRERLRATGALIAALALGVCLAAPFLVPFAEALPKSQRYAMIKADPKVSELSFTDAQSAVVALQPHFYGQVPFDREWGPSTADPMSGFAGVLAVSAALAVALLQIKRRSWRSREAFFSIALLFLVGAIFAWPGFHQVMDVVFPLSANARLRLLVVLILGIQTANALQSLDTDGRRPLLVALLIVSATLLLIFTVTKFPLPYWQQTALIAALPSLAVLLLATLMAIAGRWREWALLLLLAAVVAELFIIGQPWNPPVDGRIFFPKTPLIERLEKLPAEHEGVAPFRIAGLEALLFPNTNAVYGFEDIRAHDPMAVWRYVYFLEKTTGYNPRDYHAQLPLATPSVLDFLNVRYLLTYPAHVVEDRERFAEVYKHWDGAIYENRRVLPRIFTVRNVLPVFDQVAFWQLIQKHEDWPNTALLDSFRGSEEMRRDFFEPRAPDAPVATSRVVESGWSSYRVAVDAPRYTLVVTSIPWWPGWKVEQNGHSVKPMRVNGAFLGFPVPPGRSDVRVWYSPWSFKVGVAMALFAIAITIVAQVRSK